MELNNQFKDHDQASVSLKVLLLIFAIVLIATLGYLVWLQNTAPVDDTQNQQTNIPTISTERASATIEHRVFDGLEEQKRLVVFTFQLPSGYGAFKESRIGGDALGTTYRIGQLKDSQSMLYEAHPTSGPGLNIKVLDSSKRIADNYGDPDRYALSALSNAVKIKDFNVSNHKAVIYFEDSLSNTIHIITIKEYGEEESVAVINIAFPLTLLSPNTTYSSSEDAVERALEHPLLKSILNSMRFI